METALKGLLCYYYIIFVLVENSRKTSECSTSCLAATVSHASDKGYNLLSVSTESQSINAQTKENGSLDFGSTRSDIIKSQKSFTVISTLLPHDPSKTMTGMSKNVFLVMSLTTKTQVRYRYCFRI